MKDLSNLTNYMAKKSLPFHSDAPLIFDGRIHRYASRKKKEKDEWYFGIEFPDGHYYCKFGSWRDPSNSYVYSSKKKEDYSKKDLDTFLSVHKKYNATLASEQISAKKRGAKIWGSAEKAGGCESHEYLQKKRVSPYGARIYKDSLVIPIYDERSDLQSLQFISPSGEKRFLRGGRVVNGSFALGDLEKAEDIFVAEGFATAASVQSVVGSSNGCTVVAFSAQNAPAVGKILKKKFREKDIFLLSDIGEAGEKAANIWRKSINGNILFPKFYGLEKDGDNDFNDLANHPSLSNTLMEQIEFGKKEGEKNELVENLNEEFAAIENPNFIIIRKIRKVERSPFLERTRDHLDFTFRSRKDFKELLENRKVPLHGKNINVADIWLTSSRRNTFSRVDFNPTKLPGGYTENGHRVFNTWKGFGIVPADGGEDGCKRLKEHLFEITSCAQPLAYEYLLDLFAHWVQFPEKRTISPIFRGSHGAGKGIVTETLGEIFSGSYLLTIDHKQIFGRFNSALAGKVLVHMDEAMFGGDKKITGKIKGLITSPTINIEMKGKEPIIYRNCLKLMVSSNESFALPIDIGERRFVFYDVSNKKNRNPNYFLKLISELKNGGVEAFMYELLKRDISKFNPNEGPDLQAFGFDNILEGASTFVQYLYRSLSEGTLFLTRTNGIWRQKIRSDVLYEEYIQWTLQERRIPVSTHQAGKELEKFFGSSKLFKKSRERLADVEGYPRKYFYYIPPLEDCKQMFAYVCKQEPQALFEGDYVVE